VLDKNQIEIFKIGLASGYIELKDVVNWADKKIIDGDEDPNLIEISISNNRNELISILHNINGTIDPKVVKIGFFCILNHHYRNNPDEHISIIRSLSLILRDNEESLTNEEINMIHYLDDAYDLAVRGVIGTIDRLKQELSSFLNNYNKSFSSFFK